jgi:hypothetical protein
MLSSKKEQGNLTELEDLEIELDPQLAVEFNRRIYSDEVLRNKFFSNPSEILKEFGFHSSLVEIIKEKEVKGIIPFSEEELRKLNVLQSLTLSGNSTYEIQPKQMVTYFNVDIEIGYVLVVVVVVAVSVAGGPNESISDLVAMRHN